MTKKSLVIIEVESAPVLTLEELCHACNVTPDFIRQLIEYGALELTDQQLHYGQFTAEHLRCVRIVLHLQNDLEVNLPGAVLVLDLMGKIEKMRARIDWLEKHLGVE